MITYNGSVLKVGSSWLTKDVDYNPLGLPPYTIRLRFYDDYNPLPLDKGTGVQVSSGPDANIWDITYEDGNWGVLLGSKSIMVVEVLGANTSEVYSLANFFSGSPITTLPLFDTRNVYYMNYMFADCRNLISIPAFDTSHAGRMEYMFAYCHNLETVPLLNTSNVTTMSHMFDMGFYIANNKLTTVPLFDMSSVTDTAYMFCNCTALNSVPLLNLSSVTNMEGMFDLCSSIETVPTFNTSSASNMAGMFNHCSSLTAVPLLNTFNATNVSGMFSDCTSVESGALALYTQMSTQTNPPSDHGYCFTNCGSNTVTGAAELAQIPQSWGGTAT